MINTSPPYKGLNIRIPMIIPIKGRGGINHGSGLSPGVRLECLSHEAVLARLVICIRRGTSSGGLELT